jgi:putative transposase
VPQSLASLLVHVVFSTKDREPILSDEIREDLHDYIGGIVRDCGGTLLAAGSVADHIHLLISHPRTISPADLIKEIKIGSSKWLKHRDKSLSGFHWQAGYGIFSISPAHRPALERYIARQAEHHRLTSFQEEYRRLLTRYGIEWDERYVWD